MLSFCLFLASILPCWLSTEQPEAMQSRNASRPLRCMNIGFQIAPQTSLCAEQHVEKPCRGHLVLEAALYQLAVHLLVWFLRARRFPSPRLATLFHLRCLWSLISTYLPVLEFVLYLQWVFHSGFSWPAFNHAGHVPPEVDGKQILLNWHEMQ